MRLTTCKECIPIPKRTEFTYTYIYIMFEFIMITISRNFFTRSVIPTSRGNKF